jgi:hypothetical protein
MNHMQNKCNRETIEVKFLRGRTCFGITCCGTQQTPVDLPKAKTRHLASPKSDVLVLQGPPFLLRSFMRQDYVDVRGGNRAQEYTFKTSLNEIYSFWTEGL